MEHMQDQNTKSNQEYAGAGFVARWTIFVVCALALAFFGRVLGYDNNHLPLTTPLLAMFTAIAAAISIFAGLFIFLQGNTQRRALKKRNGIMFIVLGAFTLMGFFLFHGLVPLFFR